MPNHSSPNPAADGGSESHGRYRRDRVRNLLWLLGGWILVLSGARLIPQLPIPLPPCGLRTLTGIPCPLCGSTRALVAISQFQLREAFLFNPLVTVGCLAALVCLLAALAGFGRGRNWTARLWQRLKPKPWLAALAFGLLANWVYLMVNLP